MALAQKLVTAWGLTQSYVRGWRSRQRLVLLESDDWGAIRTASPEAFARLRETGYALERSHHSLDALETDEDLDRLFEVLGGVRDGRGRPACMTANVLLANPDFDCIRQAGFREYAWEPLAATCARSPERRGVLGRWQDGRRRRVFVPQLHAREHVAWWRWMEALRQGSPEARLTFDLGMCGVPRAVSKEGATFYGPIYVGDSEFARYGVDVAAMVREGVDLFARQLGYVPRSVTAPNYQWTDTVERLWAEAGVRWVQGRPFQHLDGGRRRVHYLGERSPAGLVYLVRNCGFEPSASPGPAIDGCLRDVERALRWHKPAAISTHRYNYVGAIDPANRDRGLAQLRDLLAAICRRWPDVRFLSAPELGRLVAEGLDTVEALDP